MRKPFQISIDLAADVLTQMEITEIFTAEMIFAVKNFGLMKEKSSFCGKFDFCGKTIYNKGVHTF